MSTLTSLLQLVNYHEERIRKSANISKVTRTRPAVLAEGTVELSLRHLSNKSNLHSNHSKIIIIIIISSNHRRSSRHLSRQPITSNNNHNSNNSSNRRNRF